MYELELRELASHDFTPCEPEYTSLSLVIVLACWTWLISWTFSRDDGSRSDSFDITTVRYHSHANGNWPLLVFVHDTALLFRSNLQSMVHASSPSASMGTKMYGCSTSHHASNKGHTHNMGFGGAPVRFSGRRNNSFGWKSIAVYQG
jgi:hypothetical protein